MHGPTTEADISVPTLADFDRNSGNRLERLVFNNRGLVIGLCAVLTLLLAVAAVLRLGLNASFDKMIPRSHPYIQNYLEYRNDLRGLGNSLRISVENTQGDIYDPKYLDTLPTSGSAAGISGSARKAGTRPKSPCTADRGR